MHTELEDFLKPSFCQFLSFFCFNRNMRQQRIFAGNLPAMFMNSKI